MKKLWKWSRRLFYVGYSTVFTLQMISFLEELPPINIVGVLVALAFAFLYLFIGIRISVSIQGVELYVGYLSKLHSAPLEWRFLSLITVGPVEELVFRGVLYQFLLKLLNGNRLGAVLLTTLLFVLKHNLRDKEQRLHLLITLAYFGILANLLVVLFPGNLWYPVICHIAVHVLLLFFTPFLIKWAKMGKALGT
jgi:membrane protease YdiL (CAAX protease family)